ncbi:MAG: hypothetical protein QOJ53_1430 [Sphingomonadales bacterium]|jgi:hypothetical protein|nr:hypothetical protein [Sphingomonadales bacterium]MEA3047098.1 hypothetical protein [Sphingomonadales bacterium]
MPSRIGVDANQPETNVGKMPKAVATAERARLAVSRVARSDFFV